MPNLPEKLGTRKFTREVGNKEIYQRSWEQGNLPEKLGTRKFTIKVGWSGWSGGLVRVQLSEILGMLGLVGVKHAFTYDATEIEQIEQVVYA